MKTAIIGASGFIGSHLLVKYRSQHPDCIGTAFRRHRNDLALFDLRQADVHALRLLETGHRAVVIAAADTSIDSCERNDESRRINVEGTLNLIGQLGRLGMHLVFLSSDNVFDGSVGHYSDHSLPNPKSAYGRHKWEIEREIGNLCEHSVVVRLSKTFGTRRGDGTLLDEMATRLVAGETILAADDLIFNPTCVRDVVAAIDAILEQGLRGTINVANPQVWSRFQLGIAMADALGRDHDQVRRVAYSDLRRDGNRPLNTSLICDRLQNELEIHFTPVEKCIQTIANNWREPRCDGRDD